MNPIFNSLKEKSRLVMAIIAVLLAGVSLDCMESVSGEAGSSESRIATPASPLGLWLSRLIYWRTESDWHYGVVAGARTGRLTRALRLMNDAPPWAVYLQWVAEKEQGSGLFEHTEFIDLRHSRDGAILMLMNWALQLDPRFGEVYQDMAYIQDHEEDRPREAEATLIRGLNRIPDYSMRARLLVDLCFLRYYRLKDPIGVLALAPSFGEFDPSASSALPSDLRSALRACRVLLQRSGNDQNCKRRGT